MSRLTIETRRMPAGRLHPPSPHCNLQPVEGNVLFGPSVLPEDREFANYGCSYSAAAYQLQDHYDRDRSVRDFKVAVLDNGILRAEFLLEYGGRLWSLMHKPSGRELLYVNPVFQPGNLALRGAWFSGGVEWNMGMPAHHPFTCSSPFFAVLDGGTRGPILRMWEWERIRCSPFQVDFYLPDDSPLLHVRCSLHNPHPDARPAYWFSNMAAPQAADIRVIVPTDFAYASGYQPGGYGLGRVPVPAEADGVDYSYPVNRGRSQDMFYRIDVPRTQPWITAVDGDGKGLFQSSTSRLKGRKLFVWGTGPGGNRWQEFLSDPGHPYIEIQAGLGRTQAECVRIEPFETIEWLEVYGLLEAPPDALHSSDWTVARAAAEAVIAKCAPASALESELQATAPLARRSPGEIIQRGSGWGAIEARRRKRAGEAPLSLDGLVFDDESIGCDERQWAELLDGGVMTPDEQQTVPGGYMAQPDWLKLLEESLVKPGGDNWLSRLHLGVLCHALGMADEAMDHWRRSAAWKANPFALRNMAFAARRRGMAQEAAEFYRQSWDLAPTDFRVAIEYLDLLLQQGSMDAMQRVFDAMPDGVASCPRVQVARARHAYATGRLDEAARLLDSIVLPDLREGDTALTDIWFGIQAHRIAKDKGVPCDDGLMDAVRKELVPPAHLDFRMA